METQTTKSLDAIINTTHSNYIENAHKYQSFQDGKKVVLLTCFVVNDSNMHLLFNVLVMSGK